MTSPKLDSIDEILGQLVLDIHKSGSDGETIDKVMFRSLEAKQALSTLVAGIIGEDEVHYSHVCPKDSTDCAMFRQRMRTRREQRLRAKEAGL